MPELPAHPSLENYKKQAKELFRAIDARNLDALDTLRRWHPRFHKLSPDQIAEQIPTVTLADAQLILPRARAFPPGPKFAAHLETLQTLRPLEDPSPPAALRDPVSLFIEFS